MKCDIILCGVGGQGILSIAAALGSAALAKKLYIKQAETHGMSQRGGDVVSHMRISDQPLSSDLIPIGGADMILSAEPMEALRYLPFLSPTGYVITNTVPFVNIPNYPEVESIMAELGKLPHVVLLDAEKIAEGINAKRAANIVMMGAAVPFIDIPYTCFEEGLRSIFARKGDEVVAMNLAAMKAGYDHAMANK